MRCGLCTGPVAFVWLPPERQKYSQCVLPTISPPSSRIRVTTVASNSGMYPSSVEAPFIIGTPATMTLSLMATRLPFSLPLGAPLMDVLRYHAFCRFSSGPGRYPGVRGYFTTGTSSGIASTALYAATYPVKSCRKASRSVSFSYRPHRVATFRICSDVGTWTAMAPSLDYSPRVQRHPTAEGDDAPWHPANAGPLLQKIGIERIGVIQAVQGTSRLRGGV